MDKIAELFRILNKENRGVITNQVPVAIFGIKLYGEAARVTFCIGRSFFAPNGRKAQENFGLLANLY
jgi:hypothetical protein